MATIVDFEKKIDLNCEFVASTDSGVNYSPLWNKYRNDFSVKPSNKSGVRSYGINKLPNKKMIAIFIKLNTLKNKVINKSSMAVSKGISTALSRLLLGKSNIVKSFWLDHPSDLKFLYFHNYPDQKIEYTKLFARLDWGYSYNSLKSFSYLGKLKQSVDLNIFEKSDCIEVGSGICNFAIMFTSHLEEFTNICVDIPEMIPSGYFSFINNHPDKEIAVFLPNEISEFKSSHSKKKVLFVLPSQLDDLDLKFNLFINHESFAEMNIKTVNQYLERIKEKLVHGAYVNLVNRISRCTDRNDVFNINNYTFFSDYDLSGLKTISKEIDRFRAVSLGAENQPNIFFIGNKL